eukprot:CAMPEP_0118634570 /NCGR_PEP_ID=MMETSP0785-20121206/1617_1 /TAXON_ID=91992 /ORGANISM="Bolidomonas pacifica, Strain CCMP 1866" /LENGTH=505 /DNA_ID=CAMNT_0006525553 /DNA_START=65 /DNA_END=1578 /DNA_ORIENTATION=+
MAKAKIRFRDLCSEDKAKLAKLISKVASLHDDSPSLGQDHVLELASLKDECKGKEETIERLLKEVDSYKSKFEQSLNIVKQYQKKMISMASELNRIKEEGHPKPNTTDSLKSDIENLASQLNTSTNSQKTVSQANASIIHSLQSELATVKSSLANKVSHIQAESREVINKTKEEVQTLERALEESREEVEKLRSQVDANAAAINTMQPPQPPPPPPPVITFDQSSHLDDVSEMPHSLHPSVQPTAPLSANLNAPSSAPARSGDDENGLGDVNTWLSFVRERSGTVDTDLSSYSLRSQPHAPEPRPPLQQRPTTSSNIKGNPIASSLDSVEWQKHAPGRPTLQDDANDRGVIMAMREDVDKLSHQLNSTLDDIYEIEVGNGIMGGQIPRTQTANSVRRVVAPAVKVGGGGEGQENEKERTPRSKVKRLLRIQERDWSPSSKAPTANLSKLKAGETGDEDEQDNEEGAGQAEQGAFESPQVQDGGGRGRGGGSGGGGDQSRGGEGEE